MTRRKPQHVRVPFARDTIKGIVHELLSSFPRSKWTAYEMLAVLRKRKGRQVQDSTMTAAFRRVRDACGGEDVWVCERVTSMVKGEQLHVYSYQGPPIVASYKGDERRAA